MALYAAKVLLSITWFKRSVFCRNWSVPLLYTILHAFLHAFPSNKVHNVCGALETGNHNDNVQFNYISCLLLKLLFVYWLASVLLATLIVGCKSKLHL